MNYPKALYQGTLDNRIMHIAQDEEHEQALREMGYVDFSQLSEARFVVIEKVDESQISEESVEKVDEVKITKSRKTKVETAQ